MEPSARTNDRTIGLLIIGVSFLAALTISWWASSTSSPSVSGAPSPPTKEGVAGFPNAVNVLSTLESARALTPREDLIGMVAVGVRSDGTVDMGKPGAEIRYVFQSERGEGPQPPRPPGTLPRRGYCGRQTVQVKAPGMYTDVDQPTALCSSKNQPLPDPRCGPKEVWNKARERQVPADARARIEYFRAQGGPAWRFEIPGTRHRFTLYGDCGHELLGRDAVGSIP